MGKFDIELKFLSLRLEKKLEYKNRINLLITRIIIKLSD